MSEKLEKLEETIKSMLKLEQVEVEGLITWSLDQPIMVTIRQGGRELRLYLEDDEEQVEVFTEFIKNIWKGSDRANCKHVE